MFFDKVLTKVFGTANERVLKRLVASGGHDQRVGAGRCSSTDEQLRAKTDEFRARIAAKLEGITDAEASKNRENARRSTRFCPRPSRWCARRAGAPCRCATSTCS